MPSFLYFDLGKVLIDFDVELMFRQVAAVAGVAPAAVEAAIITSGLQRQYEAGRISTEEFYDEFCRQTGTQADFESLATANREMFFLNEAMEQLIRRLHRAGMPLGVLSNTNPNHWEYCWQRFPVLRECFGVHVLSHRVGACKPDAAIFPRRGRDGRTCAGRHLLHRRHRRTRGRRAGRRFRRRAIRLRVPDHRRTAAAGRGSCPGEPRASARG